MARQTRGTVKEGAHGRTMGSPVLDTTVFSRVLYQLSYLAAAFSVAAGLLEKAGGRSRAFHSGS
jgi:hypothetical protein